LSQELFVQQHPHWPQATVSNMMCALLSLAMVTLASADNAQQWASTIDADKTHITSKIQSLEHSAKAMMLLEKDHSKIHSFANEAHEAASDKYQTRIEDAQGNATRMHELEEDEKTYAKKYLHDMREARKSRVLKTLGETKDAVEQMKRDRNYLEDARRTQGWSEQRFEGEEMDNEMWAEHAQLHAERHTDNATETIERIFGHAESDLEDMMMSTDTETKGGKDSLAPFQDLATMSAASFIPSIGLCLLAIASLTVGLVRFLITRTRPIPNIPAEPLLG